MRFQGLVYRAHNPQWSWDPLSGEGARLYGGRFNRRGVPALYTSLAPLTAVREATLLGRPMQPVTLCAYEVDVEPVFDALDKALCRSLGVSHPDVECPSWRAEMLAGAVPASQEPGRPPDCGRLRWNARPELRAGHRPRRCQPCPVDLGLRAALPRSPDRRRAPATEGSGAGVTAVQAMSPSGLTWSIPAKR